jgi:hypothetical protein
MKLLPMRKAGLSQTQKGKNSTQCLQVLVTGRKRIQREDKIRDVRVLSQKKVHIKKFHALYALLSRIYINLQNEVQVDIGYFMIGTT